MNDVLKIYLESGLLDIGDDDNRLSLLEKAAADLAERFKAEPREALYHALTLYSTSPSATDASFLEAGAALGNHWSTYRNRFKADPREILKPISFRALQIATSVNGELELSLGYLLRTVPKLSNPTREQVVLDNFAKELDDKAESEALDRWAISADGYDPVPSISAPTVSKVERGSIAAAIAIAAGPQDAQGQPVTGANPNWPQGSAAWTSEFGKQLSEVLAGNIEQAFLRFAKEVQKEVNKSIVTTNSRLDNQSSVVRRTQLLWWEKSRFSSRFRKPYSEMPKPLCLLAMVVDFYEISGNVTPYSAEYLLRKTIEAVCGKDALKNSDLIETGKVSVNELFGKLPIKFDERLGAQTLVESIIGSGSVVANAKGRKADASAPAQQALRIFNELQALALADDAREETK